MAVPDTGAPVHGPLRKEVESVSAFVDVGPSRAAVDGMADSAQDIRDRSFAFACAVVTAAIQIESRPSIRCILDQLTKAATAVGANLEEAKAGSSTRDFVRYVEIALREAREAAYWLRICVTLRLGPTEQIKTLAGEADQIARILGAIVVRTKSRLRNE